MVRTGARAAITRALLLVLAGCTDEIAASTGPTGSAASSSSAASTSSTGSTGGASSASSAGSTGGAGPAGGAGGCGSGETPCGGICTDLTADPDNCGACGHACPAQICIEGVCMGCDGVGWEACPGNACADVAVDPANCGACGIVCTAGPNSAGVCVDGSCSWVCAPGHADCDGDPSNGCEIDTDTDDANCGACGTVCAVPAQMCALGACVGCDQKGQAICDGNVCTGVGADPDNCGFCGNVCPGGPNGWPVCKAGVCGLGCAAGYANCDGDTSNGCETDRATDTANCGTCGHACMPGHACLDGTCE